MPREAHEGEVCVAGIGSGGSNQKLLLVLLPDPGGGEKTSLQHSCNILVNMLALNSLVPGMCVVVEHQRVIAQDLEIIFSPT